MPSLAWDRPPVARTTAGRFHADVLSLLRHKCDGQFCVLVLDRRAAAVLSACCTLADVLEKYEIAMVESLVRTRQPLPDLPALYVIEPSRDSVQRLVGDFSGPQLMYKAALVCFTRSLGADEAALLTGCVKLRQRVLCVNEVQIDYIPVESHVVTLSDRGENKPTADNTAASDTADDASPLDVYGLDDAALATHIARASGRLLTLFASLHERPYVRCCGGGDAAGSIARRMAERVAADVAAFASRGGGSGAGGHSQWHWGDGGTDDEHGAHGDERRRATLIVANRADDLVATVVHEFTYQAMLHDLVEVGASGRIEYEGGGGRSGGKAQVLQLTPSDPFWQQSRHLHVSEVSTFLKQALDRYAASNVMAVARGAGGRGGGAGVGALKAGAAGGSMSSKELAAVMKSMPQFKAAWAAHTGHTHHALLLTRKFVALGLAELSALEQTIITGVDDEGKKVAKGGEFASVLERVEALTGSDRWADALRLIVVFMAVRRRALLVDEDEAAEDEAAQDWAALKRAWRAPETAGLLGTARERLEKLLRTGNAKKSDEKKRAKMKAKRKKKKSSTPGAIPRDAKQVAAAVAAAKSNTLMTRARTPDLAAVVEGVLREASVGAAPSAGLVCVGSDVPPSTAGGLTQQRSRMPRSTRKRYVPEHLLRQGEDTVSKIMGGKTKHRAGGGTPLGTAMPRIFVYVVGGITHSECRAVYSLMEKYDREVVLVGDRVLTPRDVVRHLSGVGGARGRAEEGGGGGGAKH